MYSSGSFGRPHVSVVFMIYGCCERLYIYQVSMIQVIDFFHLEIIIPGSSTSLLTACSTFLVEKRTGFQLVKKFPTFYGT
jgi:hypothetical protein